MTNLEEKIRKQIETKKPKPYWQFLGIDITRELLILAGWAISVFLLGAIIYIICNFSPLLPLPMPRSVYYLRLFFGLPWELIVLLVIIITGGYLLSKKVSTLYRKPYILVIIIIVSLAGGYFAAEASGINEFIANKTIASQLYERQGRFLPGGRGLVTIGKITEIGEETIQIEDPTDKVWTVKINNDTKIKTGLKTGILVRVIGAREDSTIEAINISNEIPRRGACQGRHCQLPPPMPRERID